MKLFGVSAAFASALSLTLAGSMAHAEQALSAALTQGKPIIDIRARYEDVDDRNCAACAGNHANALTVRARLGYETGYWNSLSVAFDFDDIWAISGDDYNSTRNGKTTRPVIADPELLALNRLQVTYATDFDTKVIVGRQRIVLGNQRFIGNAGWRQHEQTFDAATLINTSIKDLTLAYTFLDRVNRVYGSDAPLPATGQAGHFKGDSHLINAVYVGIPHIRAEAYGYLLDLSQTGPSPVAAQRLSTETFGLRGEGKFNLTSSLGLQLNGEFARQNDYASNPLSINLDYWLGEAALTSGGFTALAGYEVLEGNGTVGFSTPLATLHAFNGWADVFLTTPANGLEDAYGKLAYAWNGVFDLKSITASVIYHDFRANHVGAEYGREWDAALDVAIDKNASLLAKYAGFDGVGPFKDKRIFWLQAAWKL